MSGYLSDLWHALKASITLLGLAPCLIILLATVFTRLAWKSLPVRSEKPRWDVNAVSLVTLIFGLIDWLLIASLPRLNLSFGPTLPTLSLVLLARLVAFIFLGLGWDIIRRFNPALLKPRGITTAVLLLVSLNLLILAIAFDALAIEPFHLQVSRIALQGPFLSSERPLRILHISDMHVERTTRREAHMLALARELQPDLILLTGDYVNLDYRDDLRTWQETRSILEQLAAPYGIYAISGTPAVDTPENLRFIFSGLNIRLLQDEMQQIDINGQTLYLLGISNLERSRDARALLEIASQLPEDDYSILLYHTPDLIETAAQAGIDLYLAGHTHGGQVHLPFYGALVTFSIYGKEFEGGLYQRGPTTLFVSRGVGMEGMGFPRARFLCPPETTLIELGANGP